MTAEQYESARKLSDERRGLKEELDLWKNEVTRRDKLGYLQGWNSNHATTFKNSIPEEVFNGFRTACMNSIRVRLATIEKEFNDL